MYISVVKSTWIDVLACQVCQSMFATGDLLGGFTDAHERRPTCGLDPVDDSNMFCSVAVLMLSSGQVLLFLIQINWHCKTAGVRADKGIFWRRSKAQK